MSLVALSDLLGVPVRDADGAVRGRVRELAVVPQDDPTRVAFAIVKTAQDDRMLPAAAIASWGTSLRARTPATEWPSYQGSDGVLLLKRDLLDQQIIDVHGRKVVRVNDVELEAIPTNGHLALNLAGVDVGARAAIRRLSRGIVPGFTLHALLDRIPSRTIQWRYVDLLETDPARRVKLKIAYEGLSRLHPADIADIVEDLPAAEREAVFETLDEGVAAEALEELDPKLQVSVVESLDNTRAADIVEEMDPDAAANLLGDLSEDRSDQILEQMEPEERKEVTQLLEFGEHTAAGHMTTEYLAVPLASSIDAVIEALKQFEGGPEAVGTIYVIADGDRTLVGAVPLVKIATSGAATPLASLMDEPACCASNTPEKDVAALFDKYNLLTLAVVDEHRRLVGIITADDIITMLRRRH